MDRTSRERRESGKKRSRKRGEAMETLGKLDIHTVQRRGNQVTWQKIDE